MKVDIGFFDKDGNYIEDIQEIDEMEMKENVCYNCGAELAKTYAEKEIIKQLQEENARLKEENLKEVVEIIRKTGKEDAIVFQMLDIQTNKANTYKQALEEIRKICVEDLWHISNTPNRDNIKDKIDEVLK